MNHDYSDELCATIREKWLAGWTDRQIGDLIDRPERSVRARRNQLGLTVKNYPKRKPLHGRLNYTAEEEDDILARYTAGEPIRSLATHYGVNDRTMDSKVRQLLSRNDHPKVIPTSRVCLRCGVPFISPLPKSINRICATCRTEADWSPLI